MTRDCSSANAMAVLSPENKINTISNVKLLIQRRSSESLLTKALLVFIYFNPKRYKKSYIAAHGFVLTQR